MARRNCLLELKIKKGFFGDVQSISPSPVIRQKATLPIVRRSPPRQKKTLAKKLVTRTQIKEEHTPEYFPNYDYLYNKKNYIIPFDKLSKSRKQLREVLDIPSNKIDFSCIDKKLKVPELDKTPSKPTHSVLPSFMINSSCRSALSEKSLRLNSHSKHSVLPLTSSFGNGLDSTKVKMRYKRRPIRIIREIKKRLYNIK